MPLQVRRGTRADRDDLVTSYVPLATGEPLWCTDTGDLFIGDGITPGGVQVNEEPVLDLTTYTGVIGNAEFINVGEQFINLNGTIQTDIVPDPSIPPESLDIGALERRFNKIWVGGNGIAIGESLIVNNGTAIQLPFDSTVGGQPIATGQGINPGDTYTISIESDDNTLIVDHINSRFTGTLRGDVTTLLGDVVIDAEAKIGTFQEINLEAPSLINGNNIAFLSNLTSFVATVPSATEPIVSVTSINDNPALGSSLSLTRSRGTLTAPAIVENGDEIASIEFSAFNGTSFVATGGLVVTVDGIPLSGQPAPTRIDVNVSDGSTIVTAAIVKSDQLEITVPVVFPNLSTTERNLLTPVVGMIIYNTTDNRFQGYQNTGGTALGWVNLS
jgi:hypothetical protein